MRKSRTLLKCRSFTIDFKFFGVQNSVKNYYFLGEGDNSPAKAPIAPEEIVAKIVTS